MELRNCFLGLCILLSIISCSDDNNIDNPETPEQSGLLFSKNENGFNELWLLQNGTEEVLITDSDFDYWWSKANIKTNQLLVYRSPRDPNNNHDNLENAALCKADIDGTNLEVIIPANSFGWRAQAVAKWKIDTNEILMCAEMMVGNDFQWRMVITDDKGQNPVIVSDYWAIDANFSPDYKKVVFVGFKDNELSFDLTKLEILEGNYDPILKQVSDIVPLTNNTTRDHDPDYSSDGSKIVFSAGNLTYSDVDIALIDVDTGAESILVNDNSSNGGSMCWSNDNETIFYHSLGIGIHPFQIKSVDVGTSVVTTLLESELNQHGHFHPEFY